jgi:autophagy-related protein 17
LYAEDERTHGQFTLVQGDFWPLDIWPGLSNPPRRYEVQALPISQEQELEEGDDGQDTDLVALLMLQRKFAHTSIDMTNLSF